MAYDIGQVTIIEYPTLATILAYYDKACAGSNQVTFEDAAHVMAQHLRRPKAVKAKPAADPPGRFTAANFAAALKLVGAVIEKRNTIPILSNVRLAASGGRLSLSGTDCDAEVTTGLSGYSGPEFDVTVRADDLAPLLKGATSVEFDLSEESRLGVVINGTTARLPILPSADFPVMTFEAVATALIDGEALRDALGFVQTAISAEETRYYLNGLYMHRTVEAGVNGLTFVSTDGSRLLKQTMPAPE